MKHLDQIKNATRLPVIISAGCSTAKLTPEAPYDRYVDIHGIDHKGTNSGEVFKNYPPPPAPYQQGRLNWPGLGKQFVNGGPNGAVAYIGCNTGGQPWAITLVEGFTAAWVRGNNSRLGDCWVEAIGYYYDKEHLASLKPNKSWEPNAIFHQAMKYMVYGDPSLRLPR
jgi:hypothetical protein